MPEQKIVSWSCFDCASCGELKTTIDDAYWIGYLAYSDHKRESPGCGTDPSLFNIAVANESERRNYEKEVKCFSTYHDLLLKSCNPDDPEVLELFEKLNGWPLEMAEKFNKIYRKYSKKLI